MQINKIGNYHIPAYTAKKAVNFGANNNEIIPKDKYKDIFLDILINDYNAYLKPDSVLKAETARIRQHLLTPITSREEYDRVLAKNLSLKHYPKESVLPKPFISTSGYENADQELKGLVPYCGLEDKSDIINSFLSGRPLPTTVINEEQTADIIRAMDYSLEKLDEKFGKYKGVVYRVGYFNPEQDKQFYSTSANSIGAVNHSIGYTPSEKEPYSIIKIKNGHNIYAFQKQTNSYFSKRIAETEREILTDRNSKFRLVPESEYTDTDIRLRNIMLTQALLKTDVINDRDIENTVNSNKDLLQYINIWEEV